MFPYDEPSFSTEIGKMRVGDSGYVVPWSIQLLTNNEGYIRSDYTVHPKEMGTVCTYIERRVDGWYCDPQTVPKSHQRREAVRQSFFNIPLNFMPTHKFPSDVVVTVSFE